MVRPIYALMFVSMTSLAGLWVSPEDALLQRATLVFSRAVDVPAAAIPAGVLMRATGIAVIPAAAGDGVRYHGKGVMSARGARPDSWTPPAVISFNGDIPLHLEAAALDFVIVAQSRRGLDLLTDTRTPSAQAMVAGAIGYNTLPETNADLLAYAHFDNYFAGVTIDRWLLRDMPASNAALYGRPYSTDEIVRGAGFFHLPTSARMWREALAEYFRKMT